MSREKWAHSPDFAFPTRKSASIAQEGTSLFEEEKKEKEIL